MRKVDSKLYDKKYFLSAVEGFKSFDNFLKDINPKFKKALKMAGLKRGEKVLDVGCGRGEMTFYANLLHGCESVGVDYSADAIDICKEISLKLKLHSSLIEFLHVDSNELPFEDESFDVIFFMDVWEHIYPEQMDKLLKEFNRVLKRGGRMIVHTSPNKIFFEVGFPKYTYYINCIINEIIYKPLFKKDMARSHKNPRSEYEKAMHINEQTAETVRISLGENGFSGRVLVDDFFSMLSEPFLFFYYLIAQPFYVPFFKNTFGEHIWANVFKK